MADTPIYTLGLWAGAQAQPWVKHDANLRLIEALIRGSVIDRDLTAPPGACADGAAYLVKAAATGAWTGHAGQLAVAVGTNASNGWIFATIATDGHILWVEDEAVRLEYVDAAWSELTTGGGGGGGLTPTEAAHDFEARASTGGGTAFNGGIWFGNKITIDADGEIASVVSALEASETGINFVPVIYADSAGAAGAVLASGPQVNDGAAGDNVLPLTTPLPVAAGDVLWVGTYMANTGGIAGTYTSATGGNSFYFIDNPPVQDPGGGLTDWGSRLRIFARGTETVPGADDAPWDGAPYVRQDGTWVAESGGGGSGGGAVGTDVGPVGFIAGGVPHAGWRISVLTIGGDASTVIAEVQFRQHTGVAELVGPGAAFASNVLAPQVAAKAFDNDPGSFWHTNGVTVAQVGYIYTTPIAVEEVTMTTRSGYNGISSAPKNFNVEYSDDGGATWNIAWSVEDAAFTGYGETKVFTGPIIAGTEKYPKKLAALNDVDATTPDTGQVLTWDGDSWGPADSAGGSGGSGGSANIGPHRYWGLFDLSCPASDLQMQGLHWDFEGVTTYPTSYTASETYGGGYAADNLLDDTGTYWAGDGQQVLSLIADFTTPVSVDNVSILPASASLTAAPTDFRIAYSDDGIVWTEVARGNKRTAYVAATWADFPVPTALVGGGGGSGGGSGRMAPVRVQKANVRGDATVTLPSTPTVGNLMVWICGGHGGGLLGYQPAGFSRVGIFYSDANNAVMCSVRRVIGGDTGSYAVTAADNQAGALYEFQDTEIVVPGTGGPLPTTGTSTFAIVVPPSPYQIDGLQLVGIESDQLSEWITFNSAAGVTSDYVVGSDGSNHSPSFATIDETSTRIVTGTSGGGAGTWTNPVWGCFHVVGAPL